MFKITLIFSVLLLFSCSHIHAKREIANTQEVTISIGTNKMIFKEIKDRERIKRLFGTSYGKSPVFVPSYSLSRDNTIKTAKFFEKFKWEYCASYPEDSDYRYACFSSKIKKVAIIGYIVDDDYHDYKCVIHIKFEKYSLDKFWKPLSRLYLRQLVEHMDPKLPAKVLNDIDSLCLLVEPEGYNVQIHIQKIKERQKKEREEYKKLKNSGQEHEAF